MKLKKVQEQEFNPLPTEFQLTPFEMLMQDIRARNYQLRKVMVSCADALAPSCLGSAPLTREPVQRSATGPQCDEGREGAGRGRGASRERSRSRLPASPSES